MSSTQMLLLVEITLIVVMLLCALGHKFGVLPFRLSFLLFLAVGALLTIAGGVALVFMFLKGSAGHAVPLLLGTLPLIAFFGLVGSGGLKVPKIHDISTRSEPPIAFSDAAVSLRKADENSLDIQKPKVLSAQKAHYTDLDSLVMSMDASSCFSRVKTVFSDLGWTEISRSDDEYWIEAYDETLLFGFKDDIRVEVMDDVSGGCRIDARSVSRVGVSDLGVNAKRIQTLFNTL